MAIPRERFRSRSEFFECRKRDIINEINSCSKDYILNVDEDQYIDYLENKFSLIPIVVHREAEEVCKPKKITQKVCLDNPYTGARYGLRPGSIVEYEGYSIDVEYPYEGDAILFFIQPNTFTIGGPSSKYFHVDESRGKLILTIECWEADAEKFNRDKQSIYNSEVASLLTIKPEVEQFNLGLRGFISKAFRECKNEYLNENSFFRAINVRSSEVPYKVEVPTIQKKRIHIPCVTSRKYESYPSIADVMYLDILKTLYRAGRAMERQPSIYSTKDEEALRDMFIFRLEDRYESATVTGETFNYGGKTDICLKDSETNANLFIAECKFWRGPKAFHEAINQLFDRYLTVRDSKVALLFFVTSNDFNSVVQTIRDEACKHEYFDSFKAVRDDSSLSYIFHLPTDKDQKIYLEIMAFHFPKHS